MGDIYCDKSSTAVSSHC